MTFSGGRLIFHRLQGTRYNGRMLFPMCAKLAQVVLPAAEALIASSNRGSVALRVLQRLDPAFQLRRRSVQSKATVTIACARSSRFNELVQAIRAVALKTGVTRYICGC